MTIVTVPSPTGELLLELTSAPAAITDEVAAWCEEARMPAHLGAPGCERAARYQDAEVPVDSLIAYHFTAGDLVRTERERALRPQPADPRRVAERLFRFERRAYRLLGAYQRAESAHAPGAPAAPVLLAVWWEPQPGTEADLDAWYAEEHIPRLLTVPGWIRISRYERVSGTGARFLAVHDLQDVAAIASPAHRAALDTPWRTKVIAQREQYERRVFLLRRELTAAPLAVAAHPDAAQAEDKQQEKE
ncbi:MAG TPA: hypothetical protein VHF26_14670 [Trebonia sp.]|nr:hypothetical protein [Trebonia sp.]